MDQFLCWAYRFRTNLRIPLILALDRGAGTALSTDSFGAILCATGDCL